MILMILLHAITIVQANPRRHLHEMCVRAVGDSCRVRGGVSSFDMQHIVHDTKLLQQHDQEQLAADGFDLRSIYRDKHACWSYNCQMANMSRLQQWSAELSKAYVLLQGTSRTFDLTKGERSLSQRQTDDHDVIEARVAKKTKGPQPGGHVHGT